jgi:RNA polymerase sigma factor (sigma-70 family)
MEAEREAERVACAYKRRCWWAELADLRQEALLAVLRAKGSYDPDVGVPFEAYAERGAARALRGYCWRQSAPVSAPHQKMHELAGLHRALLTEQLVDDILTPEDEAEAHEWRAAVQARLRMLVESSRRVAIGLSSLYEEEHPRETAVRLGIPIQEVYGCIRAARERVLADRHLWELLTQGRKPRRSSKA